MQGRAARTGCKDSKYDSANATNNDGKRYPVSTAASPVRPASREVFFFFSFTHLFGDGLAENIRYELRRYPAYACMFVYRYTQGGFACCQYENYKNVWAFIGLLPWVHLRQARLTVRWNVYKLQYAVCTIYLLPKQT